MKTLNIITLGLAAWAVSIMLVVTLFVVVDQLLG
jgi:hypothetical protein